ncbi:hypothetical protein Hdeb2414_s0005g00157021 [Helianthus debilis subsp. tardiflorus]
MEKQNAHILCIHNIALRKQAVKSLQIIIEKASELFSTLPLPKCNLKLRS